MVGNIVQKYIFYSRFFVYNYSVLFVAFVFEEEKYCKMLKLAFILKLLTQNFHNRYKRSNTKLFDSITSKNMLSVIVSLYIHAGSTQCGDVS